VASVNIKKILKTVNDVRSSTAEKPLLCLVGRGDSVGAVEAALKQGAGPGGADAVERREPGAFPARGEEIRRWRAVVLVAGDMGAVEAAPVVAAAHAAGTHVLATASPGGGMTVKDLAAWAAAAGLAPGEVCYSSGRRHAQQSLGARLATADGNAAVSLAAHLPALRRAVADRLVRATARQNGVIGAVVFIPGADMPVMTMNQVRMVLKIAAAYGEELGAERVLELLSVVGAGFGLRAVGRQALDFVPGPGWALKGVVGYTGTMGLGEAALAYFESGAPLTPAKAKRIPASIGRFKRRGAR
jgi:uncharacterized protein (DUF697 family)